MYLFWNIVGTPFGGLVIIGAIAVGLTAIYDAGKRSGGRP